MSKEFLSTIEVAKLLGISRVAVFKKIKSGEIKAQKIGRNFIIAKKDLPFLLGKELSESEKRGINETVSLVVSEYSETLKLLGKE